LDIYRQHVDQLISAGHAYYCFCTPERLTNLRERQKKMGAAPKYDQHCRQLDVSVACERSKTESYVARLAVPDEGRIVMKDIIRKKIAFDWTTVDDQVLLKTDGFPTYHLANVVDDHLMDITHVIRGEEWLPSMPKHLLLYQYFDWEAPAFAHLPLLLNKDRSKLSKRQGHVAVEDFQAQGYMPQSMVNFVALLGWHGQSNQEVYSLDELIKEFEIGRVQKGGAIFDIEKLTWLNGQHIRRTSLAEFRETIKPHLDDDWEVTEAMAAAVHTKINMLPEVRAQLGFFFEDPVQYDEPSREALTSAQAKGVLGALLAQLDEASEFTGEWFLETCKAIGSEFNLKGKMLWHPIRGAIAGRVSGPDIITIVETFGLEKCRKRIQAALELS
jgi:glutamyl-tRNA synthetase